MNYGLFLEENNYFEEAFKVLNLFFIDHVDSQYLKKMYSSAVRLILNCMHFQV
jgi:hypothetical protein